MATHAPILKQGCAYNGSDQEKKFGYTCKDERRILAVLARNKQGLGIVPILVRSRKDCALYKFNASSVQGLSVYINHSVSILQSSFPVLTLAVLKKGVCLHLM